MRKAFYLLIVVLMVVCCNCKPLAAQKVSTSKDWVEILASDSLEGRGNGTKSMEKALCLVEQQLKTLKINPFFSESYRDTFNISTKQAYNLVGELKANPPSDTYVLIGAHLDHLGIRPEKSDSIYNGANDNASGVTAVLKIAEALSQSTRKSNVLIVLFTGEEWGLLGSSHLADRLTKAKVNVKWMIGLDMLGTAINNQPGMAYLTGFSLSDFGKTANTLLEENFLKTESNENKIRLFASSDNYPFYKVMNIPAHTVSTFDFKNFDSLHKPSDECSKIDFQNLSSLIDKLSILFVRMLDKDPEIKLTKK